MSFKKGFTIHFSTKSTNFFNEITLESFNMIASLPNHWLPTLRYTLSQCFRNIHHMGSFKYGNRSESSRLMSVLKSWSSG